MFPYTSGFNNQLFIATWMSLLLKLTLLCLLFSILVWIATNYINNTCQHIVEDVRGSPFDAIQVETQVTPDTPLKDFKAKGRL